MVIPSEARDLQLIETKRRGREQSLPRFFVYGKALTQFSVCSPENIFFDDWWAGGIFGLFWFRVRLLLGNWGYALPCPVYWNQDFSGVLLPKYLAKTT